MLNQGDTNLSRVPEGCAGLPLDSDAGQEWLEEMGTRRPRPERSPGYAPGDKVIPRTTPRGGRLDGAAVLQGIIVEANDILSTVANSAAERTYL